MEREHPVHRLARNIFFFQTSIKMANLFWVHKMLDDYVGEGVGDGTVLNQTTILSM